MSNKAFIDMIISKRILTDPDFRRAADLVRIRYNLVKVIHDAPTEVVYTLRGPIGFGDPGPSNFHVKEVGGDIFYNKYH